MAERLVVGDCDSGRIQRMNLRTACVSGSGKGDAGPSSKPLDGGISFQVAAKLRLRSTPSAFPTTVSPTTPSGFDGRRSSTAPTPFEGASIAPAKAPAATRSPYVLRRRSTPTTSTIGFTSAAPIPLGDQAPPLGRVAEDHDAKASDAGAATITAAPASPITSPSVPDRSHHRPRPGFVVSDLHTPHHARGAALTQVRKNRYARRSSYFACWRAHHETCAIHSFTLISRMNQRPVRVPAAPVVPDLNINTKTFKRTAQRLIRRFHAPAPRHRSVPPRIRR